ncbi:MAG: ABC transporter ATP-binding protein [Clostridia bacterium]
MSTISKNSKEEKQDLKQDASSYSKSDVLMQIIRYHKPYTGLVVATFILMLISNLLLLLGPYLSGEAIDIIGKMKDNANFDSINQICIFMVGCYIVSSALTYIIARVMIYVGKNISKTLRTEVQDHLLDLPISYYDTKHSGDIISCLSYDIGVLNTALTNDIIQIGNSIITFTFSFIMMCTISAPMLIVLAFTTMLTIFLARHRIKYTKPLFRRRSAKLGQLNGYTEDLLSGLKTIIAYQQQEKMIERYGEQNDSASHAYFRADSQGGMMGSIMGYINNISLSLVGLVGTMFLMAGSISVGNLSAFILYSRKFTAPINELANITGEIQSAFSAGNRIFTLLEEDPEPRDIDNAIELEKSEGNVEFKNVAFGYVPGKVVLKDMNIDAKGGQTIAIVGPTGAGKTTIINLLMRFYDYQAGSVKIDGHLLGDITRESLRKSFSMVLQETWIFQGTIFENIAYVHKDATMQDIKRVAKDAKIDTFINSLPNGYQTVITDEGSNLSKGQKQLISIARAMLVDAPMLILDEATSNIDSATELLVQEAMQNLMKNKTCFVIAHRLSTIQTADKILVIGDGTIMEQGTHQELLDIGGHYHTMYYSQFV